MNILKKNWKKIVLLMIVIAGVLFFAREQFQQDKPDYEIVYPEKKTLEKVLEVSGKVDAGKRASLRFLAGGKVTFVGAVEGEWVEQWQAIATIDRRELMLQLDKQLNLYESSRIDFDQTIDDTKDIHGNKEIDRDLEQNQIGLENSVLDVELRDLALRNTTLYTPISGILVTAPAKTAGVVLAATDVFTIVDPTSIYFQADVDESDIGIVRLGQRVEISLDAFPDEFIDSEIEYVSFTSSETSSGTVFLVRAKMNAPDDYVKYRLGMNGTMTIAIEKKENVLAIPVVTLIEKDSKTYVELESAPGQVELREIEIGLETDEDIEVLSGISETDKVVQR